MILRREKTSGSWRGIRHMFGLKVRGQRTRCTGRKGGAVSVAKGGKIMPARGGVAAEGAEPAAGAEGAEPTVEAKEGSEKKEAPAAGKKEAPAAGKKEAPAADKKK